MEVVCTKPYPCILMPEFSNAFSKAVVFIEDSGNFNTLVFCLWVTIDLGKLAWGMDGMHNAEINFYHGPQKPLLCKVYCQEWLFSVSTNCNQHIQMANFNFCNT